MWRAKQTPYLPLLCTGLNSKFDVQILLTRIAASNAAANAANLVQCFLLQIKWAALASGVPIAATTPIQRHARKAG